MPFISRSFRQNIILHVPYKHIHFSWLLWTDEERPTVVWKPFVRMQQLHLSIPYDYQKIKVAQNVLKFILVLDFLKSGDVLDLEKGCNYLQASKQTTN